MERKREMEEEKKEIEKEAPFLEVASKKKERSGEKRKRSGENRENVGQDVGEDLLRELEEEDLRREEEESRTRRTFDPISRVYDARKRRVTDLKECARVTLPKPLTVTEEAKIELRREIYRKKYSEHKEVKTKNGEQISNLTPAEI